MTRRSLPKMTLLLLAVSSAFVGLTSAALILLATMLTSHFISVYSFLITSVVLHVIAAALVCSLAWKENARRSTACQNPLQPIRVMPKPDIVAALFIAGLAHSATLGTVVWVMIELTGISAASPSSPVPIVYTLIGFWAFLIISQTGLFWMLWTDRFSTTEHRSNLASQSATWPHSHEMGIANHTSTTSSGGPISMFYALTAFASAKAQRSFTTFRFSSSGERSDSAEPLRPAMVPGSLSGVTSSPRLSNESAFDYWDTSAVSADLRQSVKAEQPQTGVSPISRHNACKQGSRSKLPTIPGSRPVSPARPLDGPFLASENNTVVVEDEPILPPSPRAICMSPSFPNDRNAPNKPLPALPAFKSDRRPAMTHHSSIDSIGSMDGRLARDRLVLVQPPRPAFLRSTSLASIDSFTSPGGASPRPVPEGEYTTYESWYDDTADDPEAHLHPLFRTSSPTPPPSVSPNTVVTAAPVALVDTTVSIVRSSIDRIRDARGLSIATTASSRSNPNSPPLSPSHLSVFPQSPKSPKFPSSLMSTSRVESRVESRQESVWPSRTSSRPSSRPQSRPQSRQQSRPQSRPQSRQQSRTHSRSQSRAGSRTNIVLQGPAGDVPPTPTSPQFATYPGGLNSPGLPPAPPSPIVAVSPRGKVLTRDDLVRTGNQIVYDEDQADPQDWTRAMWESPS